MGQLTSRFACGDPRLPVASCPQPRKRLPSTYLADLPVERTVGTELGRDGLIYSRIRLGAGG